MLSILGVGDYAAAMGYYIPSALILYFVMAGIKNYSHEIKTKLKSKQHPRRTINVILC